MSRGRPRYLMDDVLEWLVIAGIMLGYGVGCVIAFVALMAAIVLPIRQIQHHYDIADCRNFAAQSGYETKFAEYTWWTWDCLAKTENGKWVSTKNLHGVNQ